MFYRYKPQICFFAVITVIFYVFPIIAGSTAAAMLIMLFLMPVCCFASALRYGLKYSFSLSIAAGTAVLFIPSIFIYYNITAWVYAVIYAVLVFIGNSIGAIINKIKKT